HTPRRMRRPPGRSRSARRSSTTPASTSSTEVFAEEPLLDAGGVAPSASDVEISHQSQDQAGDTGPRPPVTVAGAQLRDNKGDHQRDRPKRHGDLDDGDRL